MDSLSSCNSAHYPRLYASRTDSALSSQTSDTLSSRTSSFYSSGYSEDEWDDEGSASSGGSIGSNGGEEIMESYVRRLSEESRKKLIKRLESLKYNPNHRMHRIGSGCLAADSGEVRIFYIQSPS